MKTARCHATYTTWTSNIAAADVYSHAPYAIRSTVSDAPRFFLVSRCLRLLGNIFLTSLISGRVAPRISESKAMISTSQTCIWWKRFCRPPGSYIFATPSRIRKHTYAPAICHSKSLTGCPKGYIFEPVRHKSPGARAGQGKGLVLLFGSAKTYSNQLFPLWLALIT